MRYRLSAVAWVAALVVVGQAWALPPRQEAAPLSRILQALEQRAAFSASGPARRTASTSAVGPKQTCSTQTSYVSS